MLTIMCIVARTHNIEIGGATATVEKEMSSTPPRRIARLAVKIHVPHPVGAEDRKRLENGVFTCPVHKSLHPDMEIPVEFIWAS